MLIIIDYQNDFLLKGRLGKNPEQASFESFAKFQRHLKSISEWQSSVTANISKLIWKFRNRPILFSRDAHPTDHVSFLSTHLRSNQHNPEILSFLNSPAEGIKRVQLVYDKKSVSNPVESQNEYLIKRVNYIKKEPISENEVELMQELWPDHCIEYPEASFNKVGLKNYNGKNINETIQIMLSMVGESNPLIHEVRKGEHPNVESYSIVKNNLGIVFGKVSDYIREYKVEKVYLVGVATDYCVLMSSRDIADSFPDVEVFVVDDATISIGNHKTILENLKTLKSNLKIISTGQIS